MRRLLTALACVVLTSMAHAVANETPLDRYLDGLKTLRASFVQTVEDSRGRTIDRASGDIVVSRPGRFRWEIQPEGQSSQGQLLVADGRNLWFFDRDLDQVTVKPADAALTATPAMLLSGGVNVREAFEIEDAGKSDGLEWVSVTPKASDADFREARLGFAHGELRHMVLKDKLGQTATLVFERAQRNGPVKPEEVSFTPPPDADVIGTPVK